MISTAMSVKYDAIPEKTNLIRSPLLQSTSFKLLNIQISTDRDSRKERRSRRNMNVNTQLIIEFNISRHVKTSWKVVD